jgi:5'-nucleotidase
MTLRRFPLAQALALALSLMLLPDLALAQQGPWFKKVLITNDDGIGDANMQALALAFSKAARTVIVAPLADSSGTSHYSTFWRKSELRVERSRLDGNIEVIGVDGTPGDCVLLTFRGLMKTDPPDLVVSGINGGANLADDWLWSGTVGAARAAALWGGKPAIAVSGMIEGNLDFALEWLIRFASSEYVRRMKPGQYLVVNIPRIPRAEIKGIKVARPSRMAYEYSLGNLGSRNPEVWKYDGYPKAIAPDPDSDMAYYSQGYIVIEPMSVDEMDDAALEALSAAPSMIPALSE